MTGANFLKIHHGDTEFLSSFLRRASVVRIRQLINNHLNNSAMINEAVFVEWLTSLRWSGGPNSLLVELHSC